MVKPAANFPIETDKRLLDSNQLLQLYDDVGWNEYKQRNSENIALILKRSESIAYILDQDRLVAFGRIFGDGYSAQIKDIMTHPGYRKKGFATAIMATLLEYAQNNYSFVKVVDGSGLDDFYEKLGFDAPQEEKVYYKTF